MPRIVVVSSGSRHETRPFAILARSLRSRGHEVSDVEDVGRASAPLRFARLLAQCRGADVLIAGPDTVTAKVASAAGMPLLCVLLEPAALAHTGYLPLTSPPPRGRLRVLASSAHFTVPDLALYEDLRLTGFLFDERPSPPHESSPAAPAVLCLADLPQGREAAALIGCPCITAPTPSDDVLSAASVIINCGEIQSIAEGLRAGKPMIVLPARHSEYFNARAVRRLGVGTAMHRQGLEADALARVLEKVLRSEEIQSRAAAIARKLETDDGVSALCTLAESLCRVSCP